MRYVGGKRRVARELAGVIRQRAGDVGTIHEPFMGGGAMTAQLATRFEHVVASDAMPDLVLMWRALMVGWQPPEAISPEEWAALRATEPSALRGLAGFGGSFGGKWFAGYARGGTNANGRPRNHFAESARAARRIADILTSHAVEIQGPQDYRATKVLPGSVIYADPPYADTQGYETGAFDSVEFWSWANAQPVPIFVSEYSAPDGWEPIWEGSIRQSVTRPDQGRALRVERLWGRVWDSL